MCASEVGTVSLGSTGKLKFLDAWKFLNSYGSLYFNKGPGHNYEAKAVRNKTAEGSVKGIMFIEGSKDFAFVDEDCWNHEDVCDGVDIAGFREMVRDYLLSVYIE